MKYLIRTTAYNAFALFVLPQLFAGVGIYGGFGTYLMGGFALAIISLIVKPILKLITLPLTLATFGAMSFLINAVVLYLMTVIVPQIKIHSFTFHKASLSGFVIPTMHINTFFAYILAALTLSTIEVFLTWVTRK